MEIVSLFLSLLSLGMLAWFFWTVVLPKIRTVTA